MADIPPSPTGTRRLVAPELLAGLDIFPSLDLTDENLPLMRMPVAWCARAFPSNCT